MEMDGVSDMLLLVLITFWLATHLFSGKALNCRELHGELRTTSMDAKEQQLRYGVFDVRPGGPLACVAKAKDIFPHASQISGSPTPAFAGTVDDFLATHHNNPALLRQMKNKVLLDSNPE